LPVTIKIKLGSSRQGYTSLAHACPCNGPEKNIPIPLPPIEDPNNIQIQHANSREEANNREGIV
jgi:hypothetical protein